MPTDFAARFWANMDQSDGPDSCWPWQGYRYPTGYGQAYTGAGQIRAHRWAWELTYGPIPPGLHVLHRCDNPPCCNPTHLFLGTQVDNNADRHNKERDSRGEDHYKARLTANAVRWARAEYAAKGTAITTLAETLGVTKEALYSAVHGQSWGHITDVPAVPIREQRDLTDAEITDICQRYASRVTTLKEIAQEFGIDRARVRAIVQSHNGAMGLQSQSGRYTVDGAYVRQLRRQLGLSQKELMQKAGVDQDSLAWISRIENGKHKLTPRTLRILSAALETTPESLVTPAAAADQAA